MVAIISPRNVALMGGRRLTSADPDVAAWLSRVASAGGTLSKSTLSAVERFVATAKAAGWWASLFRLNLVVGDFAASLTPIVNTLGFARDVAVGIAAANYAESTGWVSTGTGYINTGAAPIPQLAGIGLYIGGNITVNATLIGYRQTPEDYRLSSFSGTIFGTAGNTNAVSCGSTSGGGFAYAMRSAINLLRGFRNGSQVASSVIESALQPAAGPAYVFAQGTSGAPLNFTEAGVRALGYCFDSGLTPSQSLSFYTALQQFQAAIGRQVGSALDSDVASWVQRVAAAGGTVSESARSAVAAFVASAKAGGWWSTLRRLNLCVGDFAASLVPLVNDLGAPVDTPVDMTAANYAESTGWVSNGACHIATGAIMPLGASGLSAYVRSAPTSNGTGRSLLGSRNGPSSAVEEISYNGGGTPSRVRAFLGSTVPQLVDSANLPGLWHVTRPLSSGVLNLYLGGVAQAAGSATAPTAVSGFGVYVMAVNQVDTRYNVAQSGQQFAAYAIDSGMTPAQVADYYAAMQAFQTAMGRAV